MHLQERIRNDIVNWLKYLRQSIGIDGWRLDFVRGYSGNFAKQYIDATVRTQHVTIMTSTAQMKGMAPSVARLTARHLTACLAMITASHAQPHHKWGLSP